MVGSDVDLLVQPILDVGLSGDASGAVYCRSTHLVLNVFAEGKGLTGGYRHAKTDVSLS